MGALTAEMRENWVTAAAMAPEVLGALGGQFKNDP